MIFSIHWTEVTLSAPEQAILQSLNKGFRSGSPEWCDSMMVLLNHESTIIRGIALDSYAYYEGPNQRLGDWYEPTEETTQLVRSCALSELNKPAFKHKDAQGMNHASALYALWIGDCWEISDRELIAKILKAHPGDETIQSLGLSLARVIFDYEEEPCLNLISIVQQIAIDPRSSISLKCEAIRARSYSITPGKEEWLENQLNDESWEIKTRALHLLLENNIEKYHSDANDLLNNWQGDWPYELTQLHEILEDKDAELITKTLLLAEDVYDRLQAAEILLNEEDEPSQHLLDAVEKVVLDTRCPQFMQEEAIRVRVTIKDTNLENWLCRLVKNPDTELGVIAIEELLDIDLEKYRNLALDFITNSTIDSSDVFDSIRDKLDGIE